MVRSHLSQKSSFIIDFVGLLRHPRFWAFVGFLMVIVSNNGQEMTKALMKVLQICLSVFLLPVNT